MTHANDNPTLELIKTLKESGELDKKANQLVGELMSIAIEIAELEHKILETWR